MFTRARRGLVGDVNSLQRVFDFLERWGLINWRPRSDPERAAGLGANVPRVVAVDVVRPERPDAGTFSAANVALYRFPPTPLNGAATSVAEAEATELAAELAAEQAGARRGRPPINPRPEQPAPVIEVPLAAHAVLYGNQGNVKRACVGCDADITGKGTAYYHCAKPPIKLAKALVGGVDVCGRCFSAGKLPDGTTSGSFLRTVAQGASSKKAKRARTVSVNEDGEEVTDDDDDDDESDAEMEQDDWTDQETLLLLEALELHGESWAEVATHVGTKSVEECIRRFIRLPIEERFLDELDPNAINSSRDPTDVRGGGDAFSTDGHRMGRPEVHLDESPNDLSVPFAGAPNPVMSNVAFLATCVAPRVAAAAARAALEAMDEEAGADAMDVDVDGKEGTDGGKTAKDIPVTDAKGREAAATGLAAAAVRAKLLADAEEREIQRLVISVAEAQMKKIEAKMRGFEDLETGLVKEREHLERMKARLFAERVELRVHKLEHEESVARAKEAQEKREATAATN
jgi:SWI/SNF related-matrix-associated actin-dependent regulator of chromatin subfamily C